MHLHTQLPAGRCHWHGSSNTRAPPTYTTRTRRRTVRATGNNSTPGDYKQQLNDSDSMNSNDWTLLGFPTYLQNTVARPFPCEEPVDAALDGRWRRENTIWQSIRRQAQVDAAAEPLLSSFMYASILAHDSFEKALAFVLANRLANTTLLPTQLFEIFVEVLQGDPDVRCGVLADVEAVFERDPSCLSLLQPLLYSKGYHALQTHRIAHALWSRGQRVMALALQSRSSEVFAVDIHPAARLGKGILLDHGTGVVIGETVVMGDNCSLLQNVTLGGTGKDMGDRHPKIADNVLIGANATVLGNIHIGRGAQIAAGSLVLKPVAPCIMVAGSPAKEVGQVQGNPAATMSHWNVEDCEPCNSSSTKLSPGTKPGPAYSTSTPTPAPAPAPKPPASTPATARPPQAAAASNGHHKPVKPPATTSASAAATNTRSPTPGGKKQTPLQHWPLSGSVGVSSDPVQPGEGI